MRIKSKTIPIEIGIVGDANIKMIFYKIKYAPKVCDPSNGLVARNE